MLKKINTFFDRSYQHGVVANPELATSRGFMILNRIIPDLLAFHALKNLSTEKHGPLSTLRRQYLDGLPQSVRKLVVNGCSERFEAMLDKCGRIELVLAINCGNLQATIRFFKKGNSTDFWIWELSCDDKGVIMQSSLTGQEHMAE